jgi:hypothetical protein
MTVGMTIGLTVAGDLWNGRVEQTLKTKNFKAMYRPFEIKFDFPLEHSPQAIPLKAKVQLHPSDAYYLVDSFFFDKTNQPGSLISILPDIEIKYLKTAGKGIWVHKDSELESVLSRAIGNAIEKIRKIAD